MSTIWTDGVPQVVIVYFLLNDRIINWWNESYIQVFDIFSRIPHWLDFLGFYRFVVLSMIKKLFIKLEENLHLVELTHLIHDLLVNSII
jgi:hypothetical protein